MSKKTSNIKTGQVIQPGDTGHSVDLEGLPHDAIKAIIKKLNERSQKSTHIFTDEYQITIENLKLLMTKVVQEFDSCTIISQTSSASIVLSNNQRFDFSSWDQFEEFDTSQPEKTRSISLSVTIDVIRGQNETPERYSVQVSVQNNPASFGIQIGPLGLRPVDGFQVPPAPIVVTVDFNNYILGKNLSSTIENWEKALKRRNPTFRVFFQKRSANIRAILAFASTLSGIFACRIMIDNWDLSPTNNLGWFLLISAATIYAFYTIGGFLSKQAERQIDRQQASNNITLTEGDKRKEEQVEQKNKRSVYKAIAFSFGVVMQISCSIAATKIWTWWLALT